MPDLPIPSFENINVALPMIVTFGWAIVLLLIDLFISNKRVTAFLAIAGLVVAAVLGLLQPATASGTFIDRTSGASMIVLDQFALAVAWTVIGAAIITILLAIDYLPRQGIERGEFYPLILFATGAMLLLAQGNDLIVLFLGLELLSIVLYVLAGFAYPRISSEEAAMKYLIFGAFATGFLVFSIALLYGATGLSNLQQIGAAVPTLASNNQTLVLVGAALVLVGFGYKVSMAPFHMWTPDVYEGAPTPVAAFMSVAVKAAAFAALTRFLLVAVGALAATWVPVVAVLAALTMILGNFTAVVQANVKRMLAYSSVGHAGYILMGIAGAGAAATSDGRNIGVQSLLFYLVAYTLSNLAAFGVLIALEKRGESAWRLDDLAGLYSRAPGLAVAMALAMLSLAGVPITAGFAGKLYVFSSAWQGGLGWLTLVGVITSAVSAFFYLRVISQMFMRDPVREVPAFTSTGLRVALVLAAVGILLVGIIPGPIVDFVQNAGLALAK